MKRSREEEYKDQKLNSRSLLEAYNQVSQSIDPEFAQEYEQNNALSERSGTSSPDDKVQSTNEALLETYAQALDSYREGTIDNEENKEN